jgi:hypothetical protein
MLKIYHGNNDLVAIYYLSAIGNCEDVINNSEAPLIKQSIHNLSQQHQEDISGYLHSMMEANLKEELPNFGGEYFAAWSHDSTLFISHTDNGNETFRVLVNVITKDQ